MLYDLGRLMTNFKSTGGMHTTLKQVAIPLLSLKPSIYLLSRLRAELASVSWWV
jgi:hypothetical protein